MMGGKFQSPVNTTEPIPSMQIKYAYLLACKDVLVYFSVKKKDKKAGFTYLFI